MADLTPEEPSASRRMPFYNTTHNNQPPFALIILLGEGLPTTTSRIERSRGQQRRIPQREEEDSCFAFLTVSMVCRVEMDQDYR